MGTEYAGTATRHATITLPENDEDPSETLFQLPLSELKDEVELLHELLKTPDAAHYIPLLTHARSRRAENDTAAGWAYEATTAAGEVVTQKSVTVNIECYFEISLPVGTHVTGIVLGVEGSYGIATHGGTLPDNMPQARVLRIDQTTGGVTQIVAPVTDSSADATAYDDSHEIDLGALDITVAADRRYLIELKGENSTNSVVGALAVHYVKVTKDPL